jgi:hypothetical protein
MEVRKSVAVFWSLSWIPSHEARWIPHMSILEFSQNIIFVSLSLFSHDISCTWIRKFDP